MRIPLSIHSVSVCLLFFYLAVIVLVTEGGGNAVLDGFDPGLSQLLGVCLHHTTPVGTHNHNNCCQLNACVRMHMEVSRVHLLLHLRTFTHIMQC